MRVSDFVDDLLFGAPTQPHRITFTDFKRQVWRNYEHAPHQQQIDRVLSGVAEYVQTRGASGIKKAMIFMPPRHGKTMSVSRMFPAWMLGHMPDLRIIMASYGATLAYRNSRTVRNLIQTPEYQTIFPGIVLSEDTAAKNEWDIKGTGGGLIAAGVGGGITGHGGHLIIIDDPIKSRAEAESDTYRQRLIDWYINDLSTRLEEPGGAVVVMLTRWHHYDLAGYLLDSEPDEWHVLSLPALAEDNDPLGRDVGTALWESHYPAALLQKRREEMGEYAFSSLYQQRPMPSKAGLFDTTKIQILDYAPDVQKPVRFYDLAVTAKKHSDYTVGLKLGITSDEDVIVYDVYRVQKSMPDVERDIVQNARIDGTSTRIYLEAEKAGIIQLDYLLRNPDMRPYAPQTVAPIGDKYTRAQPVAARCNNGKLKVLRGSWNRTFIDELAVFPMGAHDDQVDALSGAYGQLATKTSLLLWE